MNIIGAFILVLLPISFAFQWKLPRITTKGSREYNVRYCSAEAKESPFETEFSVNSSTVTLDLEQLKPFLTIAVPFFKEDETARNSLGAVVALTLLNSGISVAFSYISRDFYNALNARNEPLFYEKIELFFGALILAVPVSVFYRFVREKLSIYWREALTERVLDKYYANRMFFVLETLRDVDNPDQRISEDIRRFTKTSLDFFIALFTSVIDLFSFSAILFQIYPPLFLAIVAYAGCGSLITTRLGQDLVKANYDKIQREANFRFGLFRTRENAEAIAFYDRSATLERSTISDLLKEVLASQLDIAKIQRNLEFFTTSYRYIVQILPSLIVAPLYFANKVELGAISQSYGAFNHILGDFSIIINSFEELSAFSAGLTRLTSFIDRIEATQGWDTPGFPSPIDAPTAGPSKHLDASTSSQRTRETKLKKPLIEMRVENVMGSGGKEVLLECRNLTVFTPDGSRTVVGAVPTKDGVRGIDLEVRRGEKVLVVGSSGAGKSSLVRAIAGLWQVGSGTVTWRCPSSTDTRETMNSVPSGGVAPKDVFFLPQKPYNVLGSLRKQIMYPTVSETAPLGDQVFLEILRKVRLEGLAERIGVATLKGSSGVGAASSDLSASAAGLRAVKDWGKVLSLGEQQRLAFARILFNKPSVVVLDEATSALDLSAEAAMYQLLEELDVTFVSVGHRPTLLRYHSEKLVLGGEGRDPVKVAVQTDSEKSRELVDLAAIDANY